LNKLENEDWYKLKIEEPLRNLVKLLRNNGFNTTCSCGHYPEPYVHINCCETYEIDKLYSLLTEHRYKNFVIKFYWYNYNRLNEFKKSIEIMFNVPRVLIKESDIRDMNYESS